MIVAGRGIDRDKGNDLAVDLYIDLINAVAQILIVMRRDTVIFQQTLFKPGYVSRGVIAAVGIRHFVGKRTKNNFLKWTQ